MQRLHQSFNTSHQDANHPLWSRSFLPYGNTLCCSLCCPRWKMPGRRSCPLFQPSKKSPWTPQVLWAGFLQMPSRHQSACRIGTMPVSMGMPCEQRMCLRQASILRFHYSSRRKCLLAKRLRSLLKKALAAGFLQDLLCHQGPMRWSCRKIQK